MQRLRSTIARLAQTAGISHRFFIGLSVALVLIYALGVLTVVWTTAEIGVSASLQLRVTAVDPSFIRRSEADTRIIDEQWRVSSVKGLPIQTWAEWVQAIARIDQGEFPLGLDSDKRLNAFSDQEGRRWVELRLQSESDEATLWCRIGRVPGRIILPSILWILLETGLFFVGAVVYWNRPNDRAARTFYVQSLVVIGAYLGGYHWSRICTQPALTIAYIFCATLLPAVNLHFFLLFPSPRRVMYRRPGLVLTAVYLVPVAFCVVLIASYTVVRWLAQSGGAAEQVNSSLQWLRDVAFTYFAVAATWYLVSIAVLVAGFRHTRDSAERNQAKWVIVGSIIAAVPFGYAIILAIRNPGAFTGGAASWPLFVASACFTCAYALGITRYRLLQFDQLLNSGLAYFLVSGFAALIYCALVVTGMLFFGSRGPTLEQAAWVGGSALVLSISLDAARSRLSSYLDRRYRKDKTQIDQILRQLGGAVDQLIDAPALARTLLQVAGDLQGWPRGAVYIRDVGTSSFRLVGRRDEHPYPETIPAESQVPTALTQRPSIDRLALLPSDPIRQQLATLRADLGVGLAHGDQLLGLILLGRPPGRVAEPGDAKLLASFAPVAALALAGAEVRGSVDTLNRELQQKVDKISDQQRRIFSLQQQLIAQTRRFPAMESPAASVGELPAEPLPAAATDSIVGSSPSLQKVLEVVPKIAANRSAILIYGESGTGKELLAKAIHDLSPRAAGPYVKVHCAALAPGILESELFGHVKGAFTGAVRDKPGRFELANGGTLFLDEIGDISPEVQTKLLRVIQEKTFERVGSNEPVQVDVRLVTATHQDLEALIREGRFRADLYYRLNVITLRLPPLRERGEDVIELAHCFLRKCATKAGKVVESIDDDALLALRDFHWPGNIRELENVIERAVVVCDGSVIGLSDLPNHVVEKKSAPTSSPGPQPIRAGSGAVRSAREARHARERAEILETLRVTRWNKSEAATRLGMARSTLLSRMKKFGLSESRVE